MKKRLVSLVILILGIGLIINLSRDILRLLRAGDQIRLAETRIEELEREREELGELREYYQSEEFIEEEARNKLNMAREGETVVILPPNVRELVGRKGSEVSQQEQLPNWKKWWELFF